MSSNRCELRLSDLRCPLYYRFKDCWEQGKILLLISMGTLTDLALAKHNASYHLYLLPKLYDFL